MSKIILLADSELQEVVGGFQGYLQSGKSYFGYGRFGGGRSLLDLVLTDLCGIQLRQKQPSYGNRQ